MPKLGISLRLTPTSACWVSARHPVSLRTRGRERWPGSAAAGVSQQGDAFPPRPSGLGHLPASKRRVNLALNRRAGGVCTALEEGREGDGQLASPHLPLIVACLCGGLLRKVLARADSLCGAPSQSFRTSAAERWVPAVRARSWQRPPALPLGGSGSLHGGSLAASPSTLSPLTEAPFSLVLGSISDPPRAVLLAGGTITGRAHLPGRCTSPKPP